MSAASDPGLLYTALMLRKLHELRGFGRVLDAGTEGRYRAVLAEHLPGAVWIGVEAWGPVLGELRLRRREGRFDCADLRIAAASAQPAGVALALFEGVFEHLAPEDALTLAGAWLARSELVLASLPAALPVAAALPGLLSRFVVGGNALCFLSTDPGRARQAVQLQGVIPGIVQRMTGGA